VSLLAGADVRAITPPVDDPARPVFLAGFQGDRRATGVEHDLMVRTLAVGREDERPFVLSVVDLVGLLRADTLAIREAAASAGADVVVAATHTHSGPDTIGLWGPDEGTRGVDEERLATIRAVTASSVLVAVLSLRPASLRLATTRVAGVIRNTRDPEIVDDQVGVLALDGHDGEPIVTLVNVGVHPEVLDGDSTLLSPDMAGACVRAIEAARGGVGVWGSGDLGGMQSPSEGPRTVDEMHAKGGRVAAAALDALADAEAIHDPGVRSRSREVALPLWNPRYRAGLRSGLLRGDLRGDGSLVTEVGLLELGPARAAMWPGEVLPALGLESKRRLATPWPFLIGLANDELGYILPDEAFVEPSDWDDPGDRYEESMSVGPRTGSLLLEALDPLLG
jgi:hypothetical protein